MLALCGALLVNSPPDSEVARSADAFAAALGLDIAECWERTAEACLNRMPHAQTVVAPRDARPELAGGGVAATKMDALVNAAASRPAGARWLPGPLPRSPR